MTLTTSTGARGVVIAADRIHPDAWADDSDIDLLPNRPVQVTMHTPHPLTRQELERPGVIADLSSLVINSQAVAGAARGR
jgi:hypothetical protein